MCHGATAGHTAIGQFKADFQINEDASYIKTEELVSKALTDTGMQHLGQQLFRYNQKFESFDIVLAETIHADGTRTPVNANHVQRQDGILSSGQSFPDDKVVQVTFPRLKVGDAIHTVVRVVHRPMFPGKISFHYTFQPTFTYNDVQVTVDFPDAMPMRFAQQALATETAPTVAGRRKLIWRYASSEAIPAERSSVNPASHGAYVMGTNYKDWPEVGTAYNQGVRNAVVMTPDIMRQAQDITAGETDAKKRVELIYRWVQQHIRYVAVYLGAGAYIPRSAAEVLQTRYGDCKDHAVLFQALLQAVGIRSTQALIHLDYTTYDLPALPIDNSFNHVISYVPSLNLYLDTTSPVAPFGQLPGEDQGKPVVLISDDGGMQRTPLAGHQDNTILRKTLIRLQPSGDAVAETQISSSGPAAITSATLLRNLGNTARDWAQRGLNKSGYEGTADMQRLASSGSSADYLIRWNVSSYLSQVELGATQIQPITSGPITVNDLINDYVLDNRRFSYHCAPLEIRDEIVMDFPANMEILGIPKPVSVKGRRLEFESQYRQEGRKLIASRILRLTGNQATCTPADYAEMKPLMKKIGRAYEAQVVYRGESQD